MLNSRQLAGPTSQVFTGSWDKSSLYLRQGFDEALYITAEAEAFVKWHAGHLTWAQAARDGPIQIDGSPSFVRAFPTWNT